MTNNEAMNRSAPARIGVCALNLLLPGLGLVRLGRYRQAIAFFMGLLACWLIALGGYVLIENMTFHEWAGVIGSIFALGLVVYGGSIAMSWRASKLVEPRAGLGWRWYGVLAIWVISVLVGWPLPDIAHARYRGFYIPSLAMSPTLQVNDRLLADMHAIGPIGRGDMVIAHVNGVDYVKRVAALPGDQIALVDGTVFINGKPVMQKFAEKTVMKDGPFVLPATVSRERFPGEAKPHLVMDTGKSWVDDFSPVTLPPSRYFLLGDNRDHSSDSRLPPGPDEGLGLVARNAIIGRIAFRYWRQGVGIGPGRD